VGEGAAQPAEHPGAVFVPPCAVLVVVFGERCGGRVFVAVLMLVLVLMRSFIVVIVVTRHQRPPFSSWLFSLRRSSGNAPGRHRPRDSLLCTGDAKASDPAD